MCAPARAQDLARCGAPLEALSLEHAPSAFRERIAQGKPLKIVAIGSSSTSGAGASSRAVAVITSTDCSMPGFAKIFGANCGLTRITSAPESFSRSTP
jgi:hypothetical protein